MTEPSPLPDEETQRLLQFLYVCPVGLILFRDDGSIERINPAAVNLLVGVVEDLDHGNLFTTLQGVWPELEELVGAEAGRVGRLTGDHRVCSARGGSECWLSLAAVCVAADNNMLIVSDITSAVAAEQELIDNEARLVSIIDTAAECIVVIDSQGTILRVNPATTTTFGYPPEEMLGRNVAMLMGPPDAADHDSYLERYCATGASSIIGFGREVEGRRRDGSMVPLELAVAEWFDSSGERYFTGLLRDITQRRAQTEAQARLRKLEVASQLAGGVAHDLNNLLTVIRGNLELAEERIGDPGTQALLGRALGAVRRGVTFNTRLLSLVHDRPRAVRPVVLTDRLDEIASMVRHLVGTEVTLELRVDPGVWPVSVDAGELDSALLNLVGNARDAMAEGGTLTIDARNLTIEAGDLPPTRAAAAPGDYVELAVSDTGVGMSPDVARRATDPFFTTKPPGQGTGLGLASVAGFVYGSGGFLVIDSAPGSGTAVALYLPRGADPAVPVEQPGKGATDAQGRRILVVDDDELVRLTTAATVEALGYDVLIAASGAEAISQLAREPGIEIVLTDVVMPGMDGRELAEWIEANQPAVRVVLCSGYNTAAGGGGSDTRPRWPYLAKPYSREELGEVLGSIVSS